MIGYLSGKVIHKDLKSVILDVGGVGYKIYTNAHGLDSEEEMQSFWTYLAVRENALDLYGFTHKEELDFFELLLTVSGIGPKSSLGILTVSSVSQLRHAITTSDTSHLTKISGIGKKVAEKIVLELKDKVTGDGIHGDMLSSEIDALEALKALGYNERDVRDVLKKVADTADAGEKIRKALKLLS